MNDLLFVYGTLLGTISNSMTDYLKREGEFLGEAYLKGRLFNLGQYPGFVRDTKSPYKVFGHVLRLKQPSKALDVLDYYEGIPDGKHPTNEYERVLLEVESNNIQYICWVYVYNKSVDQLEEITSGNYLKFIETNPEHQQFIDSV